MIEPLVLISIGVVLTIIELVLTNFVFIFFGFGFIVVGLVNFAIKFSWEWQLLSAFLLSLLLLFTLKKPMKKAFFKHSGDIKDNFLDEAGVGIIKDSMIYYKGTFWQSDELDELIKNGAKDGDRVEVLGTSSNKIKLRGKN
ncbi:hypothetical protein [Campylobacter geochelonis]|uniref:hypothetical protein n=1 Tax=Campylobacter geochelonis TaxID=1780362 RepID=UPI0007707BA8|nr:hypothetical protein [Campylobacter geochelonis]CZE48707.1 nodulation efficiency protein D (NfeD) [Campylobacter geochelonis]